MNVVELRDMYFAYNDKVILENINLSVERGEFMALIGPNGSGKSTLVKLVLGLLQPTQGQVLLYGASVNKFKEWYRVGYVPQKAALTSKFPATVKEVVATGRFGRVGLGHRLRQDDWKSIEEALEMVGLISLQHCPLVELSGGQQQRAFIARALASSPDILILDEPQVGLDDRYVYDFYRLLQQLNKEQNITIIMVSHDVGAIGSWVDRIACLNRKLVCQGSPHDILTPYNLNHIYGTDHPAVAGLH